MDYEKRNVVIDSPVKLCPVDGHYLVVMPDSGGQAVCLRCGGSEFAEVMQSEAAAYRDSICVVERVEVPNEAS